ncbi:MAG: hypothetical protein ABI467_29305 [Kofleriaceae bacterium]
MRVVVVATIAGCATSIDAGLMQHAPGDGTAASINGHMAIGPVPDHILVAGFDLRGDLGASGDRFALGASVLGGVPIGRYKALARAGVWHSAFTTTDDRSIVPSFELAGYVPLDDHPTDPEHPEYGTSSDGIVIGVREDLDQRAFTTIFVGLALFFVPGY